MKMKGTITVRIQEGALSDDVVIKFVRGITTRTAIITQGEDQIALTPEGLKRLAAAIRDFAGED